MSQPHHAQWQPQPGGYPQPGAYPQPPQQKKVWPWVLGAVLLVLFLIVGGCVAFVGVVANEIDKEAKREVTVSYEAGGTGTASITYAGKGLDLGQESDVALPWSKDIELDGLVKFVSLNVRTGSEGGEVTCTITANGKIIAQDQASGPFAVAGCSGDAGITG